MRSASLTYRHAVEAGRVEQRVVLLDRALLSVHAIGITISVRAACEFVRSMTISITGDSARRSQRVAAFLQDPHAVFVRPVMQDALQYEQVAGRGDVAAARPLIEAAGPGSVVVGASLDGKRR